MADTTYSVQQKSVGEMVRKNENDYLQGSTVISKYVNFSMHDTLEKIDAYLNSKHISGETDSLGREKPFFNIVTAAVNIWFRATDLDRKDIQIKPTSDATVVPAYLATLKLQDWMRRNNFGTFLNDWGRSLARYGSTVLKFVDDGKTLTAMVIPWNRLIVDPVDFDNNVKIEVLELTEAQLRDNPNYDKDQIEALCNARAERQTLDKRNKDTKSDYIKLYEVHGKMQLSVLKASKGQEYTDDDTTTYVQQMHVISFVGDRKVGYQDFTLVSGREAKDPYMITHLIREDGRTLAIGAVEHLFEAQWMANHTAKNIKDQLDLASRLIFQTSDGDFVGQNALLAIETGDILTHKVNQPITQVANNSHDITSLQNYMTQWTDQAKEITNTPDGIAGNTMPSGTAYRQVAALNQEANNLFEIMTENKGLHVEDMLRTYILPYIKKQLTGDTKQIVATLADHGITQIESMYVKNVALQRHTRHIIDSLVQGKLPQPYNPAQAEGQVQSELNQSGSQRFIAPSAISKKTWGDMFKDLEWEVECDITSEDSPDSNFMSTLSTVLQTIATNPGVLTDPNAKLVFNKILTMTGAVSPLELVQAQPQTQQGPSQKVIETMAYKDTPPDIQRQIEGQAGLQPSQIGNTPQPAINAPQLPIAKPLAQPLK